MAQRLVVGIEVVNMAADHALELERDPEALFRQTRQTSDATAAAGKTP